MRVYFGILAAGLVVTIAGWQDRAGADREFRGDAYLGPDHLQIRTTQTRVTAVRNRNPSVTAALRLGEEVISVQTEGRVGAVLTAGRLLTVSTDSEDWIEVALDFDEGFTGQVQMSRDLVLLTTESRAVGFDGRTNATVQFPLPIGESVVEMDVAPQVAAFSTQNRTVAFTGSESGFIETVFTLQDSFQEMDVSAGIVTVETTDRFLTFRSSAAAWTTRPRPLFR